VHARRRIALAAVLSTSALVVAPVGAEPDRAGDAPNARTPAAVATDDIVSPGHGIDRLAGPDRIATAATVSRATFPRAAVVVIARADAYADALAGAPLAGQLDAPILLTPRDGLAGPTAAEIERLQASRAVLLGGEAALGPQVAQDLATRGLAVERVGGVDRFDTARLVAQRLDADTVYVTEGANPDPRRGWPDAVAVAALAAGTERPVLLVTRDAVPAATRQALDVLAPSAAVVVGGTAAVSAAVADQIAATGPAVDRLSGPDRFATSKAVADASAAAGLDPARTWLVTGLNWPDSLVAGPAAAHDGGILLLAHGDHLDGSPPVRTWMQEYAAVMSNVVLVGGTAALSQAVEDELRGTVPTGPADRALAGLRAESSIPVVIDDTDGTFLSFEVAHDPALGDDPVAQANGLLQRLEPLLQIGETEKNLHLTGVTRDESGTTHVRFGQDATGDIPVEGAEVAVHLDATHFLGLNGRWLTSIPEPTEPSVGQATAEDAAIGAVLAEQPGLVGPRIIGASGLVYLDTSLLGFGDPGARLAWQVYVQGVEKGGDQIWEVHVDAVTGAILLALNQAEDHSGGHPDDLDIFSVGGDSPSNVGCWFFTNVANRYNEDGTVDGYTPGSDTDADNANTFIRDAFDLYHGLGWYGLDGTDDKQIEMVVDVGFSPANAQWHPWCGHLRFSDQYATQDVVAHELTHGVDHYSAKLKYVNQSGALDESYADIAGAVADPADWLMGEDLPNGAIRDMETPSRSPFNDPDHMQASGSPNGIGLRTLPAGTKPDSSNDNGFVHSNSGIPNKVFSLLSDGGTYNQLRVGGISRGAAFRLFAGTHILGLTKTATFMEARNATVARAQRWARDGSFGWTTRMVCDVVNAYAAVGLGNPDGDCDGTPDGGFDSDGDGRRDNVDNCINVSNWFQEDSDGDGTGDACTDDDDGDGVLDGVDNCRTVPNPDQTDTDGDGAGDACDGGRDGDNIPDAADNCPDHYNPNQADMDRDGRGDVCDDDRDGDGVKNNVDNAPDDYNPSQADSDGDGVGDVIDNCPGLAAADQTDTDGDGLGNPCDTDDDNDGWHDAEDNCPLVANPSQQDTDGNGIGTRCDPAEAARIVGDIEQAIKADIVWQNFQEPARLPIAPCLTACPDWLDPTYGTTLTLKLDPAMDVRVVDHLGRVVGQQSEVALDGTRTVTFSPAPTYHYRAPGATTAFRQGGYELQIRSNNVYNAEIELSLKSG
jgi:Zn-dependent metalloprotease/putative cell wall-binding protein